MFIPYNTDAPLYHWPYATASLIGLNVVAFAITSSIAGSPIFMDLSKFEVVCLQYSVINPLQWVTSMFVHAGLLHLVGNMFFLWPFGLIVEGKVGWLRFLIIYFGIGITQSAVEQVSMFFFLGDGGSLGASSAIAGIMAIALIWAPKNDIHAWFLMRWFGAFHLEIPVGMMAGGFVLFDLFMAFITQFAMSTAVLHLMGSALGLVIGLLMVVTHQVDCEGYDLISIFRGREGQKTLSKKQTRELQNKQVEAQQERKIAFEQAKRNIQLYMDKGHVDVAISRFKTLKKTEPNATWEQRQLITIIKHFQNQKKWDESIPYIEQHLQQFSENAVPLRINLANILLRQSKPRKAIAVLKPLEGTTLDREKTGQVQHIVVQARQMIDDGVIEVREDES